MPTVTLTILAMVTGMAREIANSQTFSIETLQSAPLMGLAALHRALAGLTRPVRRVAPATGPR